MTQLIYEKYFEKPATEFVSEITFEEFIQEEAKGKLILKEYLNTFENRYITIEELSIIEKESGTKIGDLNVLYKQLKEELILLMQPVQELDKLIENVQQIAEGTVKEKSFTYKGKTYSKKKMEEGFEKLVMDREALFNDSFKEWDLNFCALNYRLALNLSKQDELVDLYNQHGLIVKLYKSIIEVKNTIINELNQIQMRDDVTQSEVNAFGRKVNELIVGINSDLDVIEASKFVPMPNILNGKEFRNVIVENGTFKKELGGMFENGGFDRQMTLVERAILHCQRVDQKSMGMLLSFVEDMKEEYGSLKSEIK